MGTLYVVATPIGNLEDLSLRAAKILLNTGVIACEDTRHTGQLIQQIEINPKLSLLKQESEIVGRKYVSIRDWNEVEIVPKIIDYLQTGDVALVSDAGTPLMSDPGFKLVRAARAANMSVITIPGPFAGVAALSVSGLPTNKFMFWGFLPKKWSLEPKTTHIIYESPTRYKETIINIQQLYPTAIIVIANELTKIHEQIINIEGEVPELKGEITILVYWED